MNYLIFSKINTTGIAMWWRPNRVGYTNNLDDAGRYCKEEAELYCAEAQGFAVPVEELAAYRLAARRIVDMGDGTNYALLMSHSHDRVDSIGTKIDDPLYSEACAIVRKTKKATITNLQRSLQLGYNRAARLIEAMETDGIISPMDKNGARKLLTTNAKVSGAGTASAGLPG